LDNSFSSDYSVAKASFDTFLTLRKVYTPKDYIVPRSLQSFRVSPIGTTRNLDSKSKLTWWRFLTLRFGMTDVIFWLTLTPLLKERGENHLSFV